MPGKLNLQLLKTTDANRKTSTKVLSKGLPLFIEDANTLYLGDGSNLVKDLKPVNLYLPLTGAGVEEILLYTLDGLTIYASGVGMGMDYSTGKKISIDNNLIDITHPTEISIKTPTNSDITLNNTSISLSQSNSDITLNNTSISLSQSNSYITLKENEISLYQYYNNNNKRYLNVENGQLAILVDNVEILSTLRISILGVEEISLKAGVVTADYTISPSLYTGNEVIRYKDIIVGGNTFTVKNAANTTQWDGYNISTTSPPTGQTWDSNTIYFITLELE